MSAGVFGQMATVLSGSSCVPAQADQVQARPGKTGTRAAAVRAMLLRGPADSRALGLATGLPPKQVQSVLRSELDNGRVQRRLENGRAVFYRTDESLLRLVRALKDAEELLRKHGYTVVAPGAPEQG